MALVFFGIGVPFEVDELKSRASGHEPFSALFVVFPADLWEELLSPRDDFRELLELSADEDADGGFAVEGGVLEPVSDGGFSFSTPARTSVEDFENRALD